MTNTPKEILGQIKYYLEEYQKDLLSMNDRSVGEVVRMRCNISEFINQINFWIGNLPAVLANELQNQAVGMRIADMEAFPTKTTTEICDSLESQLYTTALPSYVLNPIMFGIWEIKKREDPIDEFLKDLETIPYVNVELENPIYDKIKEKWEAKKRK